MAIRSISHGRFSKYHPYVRWTRLLSSLGVPFLFIKISMASRALKAGLAIGFAGRVIEVRETKFHFLRLWARRSLELSAQQV